MLKLSRNFLTSWHVMIHGECNATCHHSNSTSIECSRRAADQYGSSALGAASTHHPLITHPLSHGNLTYVNNAGIRLGFSDFFLDFDRNFFDFNFIELIMTNQGFVCRIDNVYVI